MPLPPSSTAAGASTWQLSDSVIAMPESRALALRRTLLMTNAAGFLAGYFVLHNQWLQLVWGLLLAGAWLMLGGFQELTDGLKKDRWLMAATGLITVVLVRSSLFPSLDMTKEALLLGWANCGLLVGFFLLLWQAARLPRAVPIISASLVTGAVLAAVGSLVVFYLLHPHGVFLGRLRNWFVYGGLNSVSSGIFFGFAATWALACWNSAQQSWQRRLWLGAAVLLLTATLFTLARGALLALFIGHAALFLFRGWRRSWRPVLLLLVMVGSFQVSAPILSHLAVNDASKRLGIQDKTETARRLGDQVVSSNPMQAALERSDNGRFLIYGAALHTLTTWQDWLLGKGLWADDDCWRCALHWDPEHLHSIFMDALVHSGLPGLLGLLALICWGAWRSVLLARRGEELWLMLLGYGIGSMLFDGDSAFAMLSIPRFEPLLLWTPLIMASARFTPSSASA